MFPCFRGVVACHFFRAHSLRKHGARCRSTFAHIVYSYSILKLGKAMAKKNKKPEAKKKVQRSSVAETNATPPATPKTDSAEPEPAGTRLMMPVVGIGASAGGLDAFKKLFSAMPDDSGIAFVLIPHLDPTHESLMVEL